MNDFSITQPTLLLNKKRCLSNIEGMVEKAKKAGVDLRPHFKTHQSHEIGRWFREFGVNRITCSSLAMASYFAEDGWEDITVAFPVNALEADLINELGSKINLNLLVESVDAVKLLGSKLREYVGIFLKIDAGYGRTGIEFKNFEIIDDVIDAVSRFGKMNFKGFLSHAGNSYSARSVDEIADVHLKALTHLSILKDHYAKSIPNPIISVGDTPTCSVMNEFGVANEIRPGCFVFHDIMQQQIGSCDYLQIAVALACPVVALHEERNEIVIYGGGVHFSKDSILQYGKIIYGKVAKSNRFGWGTPVEDVYLIGLSQEHGIITAPDSFFNEVKVGDILYILPAHVCMAADLFSGYKTLEGEWIEKRINSLQ